MHGDDITIGEERSTVEILIIIISKRYEIKKQVIGEDPDLEKSGRILNRVIVWNRDGITIEAQRHVREILKASSWSERITPRLHVPWRGRMQATGEPTWTGTDTD